MGKLFNFIIIDEFTYKKPGSLYFLTHWHAGRYFTYSKNIDHYMGISNKWPYGPIYCSPITKKLLLSKYPKLKDTVIELKYSQDNLIETDSTINTLGVKPKPSSELNVRIYDSNHMAGSVMILFQYQGKNYLHTGDMRFNRTLAENTPDLFIKSQENQNDQAEKQTYQFRCKYQIQKLFLDNTFCDPIFMFPPRVTFYYYSDHVQSFALKLITKIVDDYRPKKMFICTDSVGKEEVFLFLSQKYKCRVKVNRDRMRYIKCMGLDHDKYFTLKDEEGCWIESIRKSEKQKRVTQEKGSIAVTLTGWANINDYYPTGYNCFVKIDMIRQLQIVPYSLHSNYKQIEMCVRYVNPKCIIPVVEHRDQKKSNQFREKIGSFQSYMFSLGYMKQRGLEYLQKQMKFREEKYETGDERNRIRVRFEEDSKNSGSFSECSDADEEK